MVVLPGRKSLNFSIILLSSGSYLVYEKNEKREAEWTRMVSSELPVILLPLPPLRDSYISCFSQLPFCLYFVTFSAFLALPLAFIFTLSINLGGSLSFKIYKVDWQFLILFRFYMV